MLLLPWACSPMTDSACFTTLSTAWAPSTSLIRFSPLASSSPSLAAIWTPQSTAICTHCGIATAMLCPNVAGAAAIAWVMIGTILPIASVISRVTSATTWATTSPALIIAVALVSAVSATESTPSTSSLPVLA